jgi:hypothetical protein
MAKIKLVKKKTNEMSGTGGSASATPGTGAQYASPKAFPKVASDYNKTFGTHFAPSIPNRPSKAITYKELWEAGEYDSLVSILKQLGAEKDSIKVLLKAVEMGALKPSDAIIITKKALGMKEGYGEFDMEDDGPDYNNISDLEDELRRLVRWSNQYGSKGADAQIDQLRKRIEYLKSQVTNEETSDDANFDSATTGASGLQTMNPLPIKEGRYSEFKKTTQVRTPSEQMHRAVREIRRKIDEINKLVDYTEKMKSEMKSDVNEVRYLNRTKEALAKISAKIQETNNKIKRLVQ